MLQLQTLVRLLKLAQFLEFRRHFLVEFDTLGHDQSLPRLFAPARQHERVDAERLGHLAHLHARQLAQPDCSSFEFFTIPPCRQRTWFCHSQHS